MGQRDSRRRGIGALGGVAAAELIVAALFAVLSSSSSAPASHRAAPLQAVAPAGPTARPPADKDAIGASKQAPAGAVPSTSSTATATAGVTQTGPSSAVPESNPGPTGGASSAVVSTPAATVTPATVTTAPAPQVTCETDLPLAQSPDASYSFLCRNGDTPLTWASDRITVYTSGLTAAQNLALPVAMAEWEHFGQFQVSFVSTAQDAQVVVSGSALGPAQPGYTEDGYTTVSYVCGASRCVYDKAMVVLSSTAALTQTDWISTILHELGHVAGLNHVAQIGEVMYPYLTAGSPAEYASGDKEGLALLAAERTS